VLTRLPAVIAAFLGLAFVPAADAVVFSTGEPDGLMGMASRQGTVAAPEIEAADDFLLSASDTINRLSFTGLVPAGSNPIDVGIEIYRVFPLDSTNPPDGRVPTRVNSPSDNDFASVDSTTPGALSFTTATLERNYTVANSIVNGINASPNQTTGGEGPVSGVEKRFDVVLATPLSLPAGHYFFVPQVRLSSGNFLWLSAPKPIVSPGTPFSPDLQAWIRNASLAPDWLRAGTDIVGGAVAPTFNASFSLNCPTLSASPTSLPSATVGQPYLAQLTAAGGTGPYTFATGDPLPPGVTLRSDGLLVGTPMQAGSFPMAVTVTDSVGCQGTSVVTVTVVPSRPQLHLSGKPRFDGKHVVVGLACASNGTMCTGTVELLVTETVTIQSHGRTHRLRLAVVIAGKSYSIAPGHTSTVKLPLNGQGKRLLGLLRRLRASGKVILVQANGPSTAISFKLTLKKHHR
jgi:hypothetical protein